MVGNLDVLEKLLKDVKKAIKAAEKKEDVKNKMSLMMIKRDLTLLIKRVRDYYETFGV